MNRPGGTLDIATALRPYRGTWNARLASHLLRRAGFGGTSDEVGRLNGVAMDDAVGSLIEFPSTTDLPEPGNVYDPRPVLMQLFTAQKSAGDMQKRQLGMELRQNERQSIISLQEWWLHRMLSSPAPLQEKMAL